MISGVIFFNLNILKRAINLYVLKRGLGFTGGTLDKLESIPNYKVHQHVEQVEDLIDRIGCCIVGQSDKLNPADKTLYATRDITNTVDCIPLIAASIISKKAIEDLDALVLDVKVGKASFMPNQKDAEILSDYMLKISNKLGFKAGVFLTRHDNPIGRTIGNQIEIEETIECLHGEMSKDMEELVTQYGGYLLYKTQRATSLEAGAKLILEKLKNKEALDRFQKMLIAQGVDEQLAHELCVKRNYNVFPKKSKFVSLIKAQQSGYIKHIDALVLGNIAAKLGAGRAKSGKKIEIKIKIINCLLFFIKGDKISFEVGFKLIKTVGDRIDINEPWLQVYHNNADFDDLYASALVNSIEFHHEPVNVESLIIKIMDSDMN